MTGLIIAACIACGTTMYVSIRPVLSRMGWI